ncbi:MAG: flavodoxin family protein [bacterium]
MPGVLGISASARVWGNCETAVKLALLAARSRGAQTDFLRLPDLDIRQCRGCFACLAGEGGCALADDLAGLLVRVGKADGLVVASPVYFGLPPSSLVALLGRLLATTRGDGAGASGSRGAVVVTLMGNAKWRGLAEPIVNLTASLMGFEVLASLGVVAEGPGEVLSDAEAVRRLGEAGCLLGAGAAPTRTTTPTGSAAATGPEVAVAPCAGSVSRSPGACPRCGCDAFRLESGARPEPGALECPICGQRGDLEAYLRTGAFQATPCEPRWGRSWLAGHVASWIKPSISGYRTRRKEILRGLAGLKRTYSSAAGEEGHEGPRCPGGE